MLEVRPALKQPKANIYFGCIKDQIVMRDDLIAPTDVESYEPFSTQKELRKEIELADKNSRQELKNLGFAKDSLKIVGDIIASPHFDEVITCADSCESAPTIEPTKKEPNLMDLCAYLSKPSRSLSLEDICSSD